jgi:hypothetical protein
MRPEEVTSMCLILLYISRFYEILMEELLPQCNPHDHSQLVSKSSSTKLGTSTRSTTMNFSSVIESVTIGYILGETSSYLSITPTLVI